ncbi:MAG: hypothetical protein ABL883_14525 [Terricaulis sp.]
MKTKLFAGLVAALALAGMAAPASAQDFGRDRGGGRDGGYQDGYRGDRDDYRGDRHRGQRGITIRKDGRVFTVNRDDRLFYRLLDRPYGFQPGLTYAYTDRCNRFGCVAFVFDGRNRRPIDRIFAPHLQRRGYAWRQARGFDDGFSRFGRYDRDERGWNNDDDRSFREGRDGRGDRDRRAMLEGRVR